jgi:uncharacterized protein
MRLFLTATFVAVALRIMIGPVIAWGGSKLVPNTSDVENCFRYSDIEAEHYDADTAVAFCERAAAQGNTEAKWVLFQLYTRGDLQNGQDFTKAVDWGKQAAEEGHPWAQYQLANLLIDGLGAATDLSRAQQWMSRAAEQGHQLAKADLAIITVAARLPPDEATGIFFDSAVRYIQSKPPQPAAAFRWMKRAADRGHALAELNTGILLLNGYGIGERQPALAIDYFQRAAERGVSEAMLQLGVIYANGDGVRPDMVVAVKWLSKAAEKKNLKAMNEMADLLFNGRHVEQDIEKAISYWKAAAEGGLASAQFNYGLLYYKGDFVKRDAAAAFEWCEKAAEAGVVEAQLLVAEMYRSGALGKPDNASAMSWLVRAADAGSAKAALTIGEMIQETASSAAQHEEARSWYLKAAQRNERNAFLALGNGHEKGSFGEVSLVQAYMWANLAVAIFPVDDSWKAAVEMRKRLSHQISETQRRRAAIEGLNWLRQNFSETYFEIPRVGD